MRSLLTGCPTIRMPDLYHPGSAGYQRANALQFDPYPLDDVAPPVAGGRPREYDRPIPEVKRGQTFTPKRPELAADRHAVVRAFRRTVIAAPALPGDRLAIRTAGERALSARAAGSVDAAVCRAWSARRIDAKCVLTRGPTVDPLALVRRQYAVAPPMIGSHGPKRTAQSSTDDTGIRCRRRPTAHCAARRRRAARSRAPTGCRKCSPPPASPAAASASS